MLSGAAVEPAAEWAAREGEQPAANFCPVSSPGVRDRGIEISSSLRYDYLD